MSVWLNAVVELIFVWFLWLKTKHAIHWVWGNFSLWQRSAVSDCFCLNMQQAAASDSGALKLPWPPQQSAVLLTVWLLAACWLLGVVQPAGHQTGETGQLNTGLWTLLCYPVKKQLIIKCTFSEAGERTSNCIDFVFLAFIVTVVLCGAAESVEGEAGRREMRW